MIIVKNLKVVAKKVYSRSYGRGVENSYAYGTINGTKLVCLNELGCEEAKYRIGTIKLENYSFEKEISEEIMNKEIAKLNRKNKKEFEKSRIAKYEAEAAAAEELQTLKNECSQSILNNVTRLRAFITTEQIELRLAKNMQTNEICNRAIGIVGYSFAKKLGWLNVLSQINKVLKSNL